MLIKHVEAQPIRPPVTVGPAMAPVDDRALPRTRILSGVVHRAPSVPAAFRPGPHVAWVEYNRLTGKVITDPLAVQVAGHYLKSAIESGLDNGREMYTLTVDDEPPPLVVVKLCVAALEALPAVSVAISEMVRVPAEA